MKLSELETVVQIRRLSDGQVLLGRRARWDAEEGCWYEVHENVTARIEPDDRAQTVRRGILQSVEHAADELQEFLEQIRGLEPEDDSLHGVLDEAPDRACVQLVTLALPFQPCTRAPKGWSCTRGYHLDHTPCAAIPEVIEPKQDCICTPGEPCLYHYGKEKLGYGK